MMVEHNQSTYNPTNGGYNNAYKFNGKELDDATGMYYYGARYYDPRISIFVSVDPLAESTMTPYQYVHNNPIMFTDPTGMSADHIIIVYQNDKGQNKGFKFNGQNAENAPDNKFVKDFLKAYEYNLKNGGGDNLKKAAEDNNFHYVRELTGDQSSFKQTTYDSQGNEQPTVFWNPYQGLRTDEDIRGVEILSPATILEHEMDHQVHSFENSKEHHNLSKTPHKDYTNFEEKRVIQGSETKTARANREISPFKQYSRKTHGGTSVKVSSPTSNIDKSKEGNTKRVGFYRF